MIQDDIFGRSPMFGDTIIFNPPYYKGLLHGKCIGFTKSGLPMLIDIQNCSSRIDWEIKKKGYYSPKTGFIIK